MKKKLVIFDLDGTLVNSIYAIANAVNKALDSFNLKTYSPHTYYNFVGMGLKKVVEKIVKLEKYNIEVDNLLNKVLEIYNKEYLYMLEPYDGILDLLKYLDDNNILYSIITNKDQELATKTVINSKLKTFDFKDIIGLDINNREISKPNPYNVNKLIQKYNLKKEEVVFVGDMLVDYNTAKNSSVDFIYTNWGFGKMINEDVETKYMVNNVEELILRL